jgi:hypothetical protein
MPEVIALITDSGYYKSNIRWRNCGHNTQTYYNHPKSGD